MEAGRRACSTDVECGSGPLPRPTTRYSRWIGWLGGGAGRNRRFSFAETDTQRAASCSPWPPWFIASFALAVPIASRRQLATLMLLPTSD